MNSRIVVTADGSRTLTADETGTEIYHSRHGALQESLYVFIQQGLDAMPVHENKISPPIRLMEVGFGTGLNALLALQWSQRHRRDVTYVGLEPNRLSMDVLQELEYPQMLSLAPAAFQELHETSLLEVDCFKAQVLTVNVQDFEIGSSQFDLCWFDAFSPRYQAQIWSELVFKKIYDLLTPGGRLVTYSAKGEVQRMLKALGFDLEKLPGPPGKREMIRATRPA